MLFFFWNLAILPKSWSCVTTPMRSSKEFLSAESNMTMNAWIRQRYSLPKGRRVGGFSAFSGSSGKAIPVKGQLSSLLQSAPLLSNLVPSEADFLALTAGHHFYRPFYFESNDFFELPVTKLQLTQRAAEKLWSHPIWLRSDTLETIRAVAAPLESPHAMWLPQCGTTFRSLESLPPKSQHNILNSFRVPSSIPRTGAHLVLAPNYIHFLPHCGRLESHAPEMTSSQMPPSMSRQWYTWQPATPQFSQLFDAAWDLCHPIVERSKTKPRGSRASMREVPPQHPREKMWVAVSAAVACHAEALRTYYHLPQGATVTTPPHAGLFFNASQLFFNRVLQEKTDEVMARIAELDRSATNIVSIGCEPIADESPWSATISSRARWPPSVSSRVSSLFSVTQHDLLHSEAQIDRDESTSPSADAFMSLLSDDAAACADAEGIRYDAVSEVPVEVADSDEQDTVAAHDMDQNRDESPDIDTHRFISSQDVDVYLDDVASHDARCCTLDADEEVSYEIGGAAVAASNESVAIDDDVACHDLLYMDANVFAEHEPIDGVECGTEQQHLDSVAAADSAVYLHPASGISAMATLSTVHVRGSNGAFSIHQGTPETIHDFEELSSEAASFSPKGLA